MEAYCISWMYSAKKSSWPLIAKYDCLWGAMFCLPGPPETALSKQFRVGRAIYMRFPEEKLFMTNSRRAVLFMHGAEIEGLALRGGLRLVATCALRDGRSSQWGLRSIWGVQGYLRSKRCSIRGVVLLVNGCRGCTFCTIPGESHFLWWTQGGHALCEVAHSSLILKKW